MTIQIKEVTDRSCLKQFIHLPELIHKDHTNWLPNIIADEWSFFDARKNHAFAYCDTRLLLAFKDDIPVGRIMGIINHKYNRIRDEKHARWGFLECYNDQEVAHALIHAIEIWAQEKGMVKMIGPYGFSDKDPQGLLVEGFEHPPLIASACNFPYLVDLVEKEGYTKEIDCFVYKYNLSEKLPDVYQRVAGRMMTRTEYEVLEFKKRSEFKPYIVPILSMMNASYQHLYGYSPLDDQEMMDLANRYKPILFPDFVKAVQLNGQIIGFLIAIPNMTRGIQKSRGRLFPFGVFHILNAVRKTRQLDLMLGGVHPDFQGRGLEILMTLRLFESMKKKGYNVIEVHLMLETNTRVLSEMHRANAGLHKRFRVFQKPLVGEV